MSEPEFGKDQLQRAAQAGLVSHVVCVLGDRPAGDVGALTGRLTSAELIGLDSVAMAFLCERWTGPVVRVAPLVYAVDAEGREADLAREAARLGRKIAGAESLSLVRVLPIPVDPAPELHVEDLKAEIARLEAALAQARPAQAAPAAPLLEAAAARLESTIARLEMTQAAAVGDPDLRDSMARSLAALRFAVREIAGRAEDVKSAADSLSERALERGGVLDQRLEAIAAAIAALEQRAALRAQRDFSPEAESLQRVLVGFRTVLRELSEKAGAVRGDAAETSALEAKIDRIAGLLEAATQSGQTDVAETVVARLEQRFEAVEQRLAARAGVPAHELAFGKDSFVRLIAGFRVVLRRLSEQADHLAERAAPITSAPAGLNEAALDRLAQRIAEQVSGAMAEGLALMERRRVEAAGARPPEGDERQEALTSADGVGFALDRIARRVEALHEDLAMRFASLARAEQAGDGEVAADRAAQRLASGVQEAKMLMSEFLGIAAALTRDLDRTPQAAAPAPRPSLLRADARLLRRPA